MSPLPHAPEDFRSTAIVYDDSAISDTEEPFEHEHDDHESRFDHLIDGIARRLSVEAAAGPAQLYRPRTGSNSTRPGSFTSHRSHRRSTSFHHHRGDSFNSHRDHGSFSSKKNRGSFTKQNHVRWHSHVPDRLDRPPHHGATLAFTRSRDDHHLPRIDSEKTLVRTPSGTSSGSSRTKNSASSDIVKDVESVEEPALPAALGENNDGDKDVESRVSVVPLEEEDPPPLSKARKIVLVVVVMLCLFISVSSKG